MHHISKSRPQATAFCEDTRSLELVCQIAAQASDSGTQPPHKSVSHTVLTSGMPVHRFSKDQPQATAHCVCAFSLKTLCQIAVQAGKP